jgi:hypothetical protein
VEEIFNRRVTQIGVGIDRRDLRREMLRGLLSNPRDSELCQLDDWGLEGQQKSLHSQFRRFLWQGPLLRIGFKLLAQRLLTQSPVLN